ncbi:hypothetical protein [Bradyrhizobium sp.]|uniref:hypothetical protein n=1 Tax=Bradyrhizobium sp. TaxID=376 RepID=UPI0025C6B7E8|nr:hypothetical protein [Bradyrhizobium sp.]
MGTALKRREIDFDKIRTARQVDDRGPTPQRLGKASLGHEVGDDRQGRRVYFIEQRPIVAMLKARQIDGKQFGALDKFHKHWFNAKLGGGCRSVDFNRIYAPDPFDYLDASARQWFNRKEYNRALDKLAFQERVIATNLILSETMTAEQCGYGLGYRSPYRARSAAVVVVRGMADKFVDLWGMK